MLCIINDMRKYSTISYLLAKLWLLQFCTRSLHKMTIIYKTALVYDAHSTKSVLGCTVIPVTVKLHTSYSQQRSCCKPWKQLYVCTYTIN